MLVRRVQMTALLLSLNDSWPKTTCKWRLLPIIISQLVWTYRLSLTSQSSSFAPVSVLVSMVSSVFVLVSPVSPFSTSDSSYTAFTIYCDDHSSLSSSTAVQKWIISYTSHHFTPHGRYELNKLTSLPLCGFIAQLVEQRTGNAEVTGSNPVEALIFFRLLLSNCLNWKIYCNDHSSLSSSTAVQKWIISYTSHSHYSHTHYHHYPSVRPHALHQRSIHFLPRVVQDYLLKKNISTLHWLPVIFYDGKQVGLSFVSSLRMSTGTTSEKSSCSISAATTTFSEKHWF